jgi:CobQ-like glutamine amidotransferase family enzyme
MIENGIPGLYICGAYQFLGKYYKEADGTIIHGLGIFDLYTENPGAEVKRLIGNIAVTLTDEKNTQHQLVGFENHGGRTYLGKDIQPMARVTNGFGNNGEDHTEGAKYKNSFGSFFSITLLQRKQNKIVLRQYLLLLLLQ